MIKTYHRPQTLDEALALLNQPDTFPLGGGTLLSQPTVDLALKADSPTKYERSDFSPVPRAVPILEAMVAFVLADALLEKLGGDSIGEMKPRFETLRKATLDDLQMDNIPHIFWE